MSERLRVECWSRLEPAFGNLRTELEPLSIGRWQVLLSPQTDYCSFNGYVSAPLAEPDDDADMIDLSLVFTNEPQGLAASADISIRCKPVYVEAFWKDPAPVDAAMVHGWAIERTELAAQFFLQQVHLIRSWVVPGSRTTPR